MTLSISANMLAPCGMNCGVCYAHLKKKKPCGGCMSGGETIPPSCRKCRIKDCAAEKKLSHCFKCTQFPCKSIKSLEKSYVKRYGVSLIENSNKALQLGIDALMESESIRWTCPSCGGAISLHDAQCTGCAKVFMPGGSLAAEDSQ